MKYIFGYTSIYGDFEEVLVNPDDALRLQSILKKFEALTETKEQ